MTRWCGAPGTISAVTAVLMAVLLAGCGDDDPSPDTAAQGTSSSAVPSDVDSPSSTSPASEPWRPLGGSLGRCGPQPASVSAAKPRYLDLVEPGLGSVPAVRMGRGRTVAVMLHQTDGNGLCGWLPFASHVAREAGLAALMIDLCQYGMAECRKVTDRTFEDADQTDAVAAAVRFARSRMGAERVVVVGASMGGSVALMSAAGLGGLDSAVSLSGPVDWAGMEAVADGRRVRVPVLVAMADSEGEEQVAGARQIVQNAPRGSRFLPADTGHGYGLVADADGNPVALADDVLAWLQKA